MRELVLALTCILIAAASLAQTYRSPQWNRCIDQFYDRDAYNWLSFRNHCPESLTIVFIPNNPGYGGSSIDLPPGARESTGFSRAEVSQRHGFVLYVCPRDSQPVDGGDHYVNRVNTRFRCKQE